jgi:hypothetical protein
VPDLVWILLAVIEADAWVRVDGERGEVRVTRKT